MLYRLFNERLANNTNQINMEDFMMIGCYTFYF